MNYSSSILSNNFQKESCIEVTPSIIAITAISSLGISPSSLKNFKLW